MTKKRMGAFLVWCPSRNTTWRSIYHRLDTFSLKKPFVVGYHRYDGELQFLVGCPVQDVY